MHKFKWMISLILMTLTVVPLSQFSMAIAAPKQPTSQPSWKNFFNRLFGAGEPKDRGWGGPGGGRPIDGVCLISPVQLEQVWNNQPLFIWQGAWSEIGVRPAGSEAVLWRQGVAGNRKDLKTALYPEQPLQPGQRYEWVFYFDQTKQNPVYSVPFQIMDEGDRAPITADLQALNTRLKTQRASQEAIALHHANYFAQRQLWADALQAAYSVNNPSAELKQVSEEIVAKLCQAK